MLGEQDKKGLVFGKKKRQIWCLRKKMGRFGVWGREGRGLVLGEGMSYLHHEGVGA